MSMSRIVIRSAGPSLLCGPPESQVIGARGKSGTRIYVYQHALLSLIKSSERDEHKHNKRIKNLSMLSLQCPPPPHTHTSQAACSSCNLWCFCIFVDEKDVDSDAPSFYPTFYLDCYMKADKGGERNS